MGDHRGEISLCQDKTGPGGGRDLQILVEGSSETGRRVCRVNSQAVFWYFWSHLGCSGISWKAYWGIVLKTSFTWAPDGISLVRILSTVTSEASVRGLQRWNLLTIHEHKRSLSTHSMGRSDMSEVNFFCLGRGLVCFLNSVLI